MPLSNPMPRLKGIETPELWVRVGDLD